jgi:hypothetical protein
MRDVVGFANGIDIEGAIRDGIHGNAQLIYQVVDIAVFDDGGFTGRKTTRVQMRVYIP